MTNMIEQAAQAIAEATVGSPENNYEAMMNQQALIYRHNQFMSLSNNRFTKLLKQGKAGSYSKQKQVVEQGLSKIYYLLDKLN
jgi:hypothetical protein